MSLFHRLFLAAAVLAAASAVSTACREEGEPLAPQGHDHGVGAPDFTMGSGSVSTPLGRATFADADSQVFKVKRITGDWHVEIKAKPAVDIAVQRITFEPGGYSGWHRHPGPVFIQVVAGEMTFYESNDPTCSPIVKKQGEGYLDAGVHAHIARNESGAPSENVVTYFAPPGAQLRIDEPTPGNCPF